MKSDIFASFFLVFPQHLSNDHNVDVRDEDPQVCTTSINDISSNPAHLEEIDGFRV